MNHDMYDDKIIDLSVGHPLDDALKPILFQNAINEMFLERNMKHWLRYDDGFGSPIFRETLANFLTQQYKLHDEESGIILGNDPSYNEVNSDQLFLTPGASEAVHKLSCLLGYEGDLVLVEDPTYYLISQIFIDNRQIVKGFPSDDEGIDVDLLETRLQEGLRPKFVYVISTFSNPAAKLLSAKRRSKLCKLAHEYEFYVISDEVYQLLYFESYPPLPIALFEDTHHDEGRVFSVCSFSKTLSPGIRVGYIHSKYPQTIAMLCESGSIQSGGCPCHFTTGIVNSIVAGGSFAKNLLSVRETYRSQRDALYSQIRSEFRRLHSLRLLSDEQLEQLLSFQKPKGGFFLWITFPRSLGESCKAKNLLKLAGDFDIGFRCGEDFSPENTSPDPPHQYSIRLCYACFHPETLKTFACKFGQLFEKVLRSTARN